MTWPYTASDRPSAPQVYQCLLSHFLATLGAQEKTDFASMLWSIDSCQNNVSAGQYHLTHPGRVFFEVIRWQVKSFQIIEGSSMFFKIHMKYGVFMSLWPRTIKIVISNWPWTRKFSQIYLIHSGKTDAFHFCHHSHALVTLYAQLLCSDWSKFDRRVHEEN